MKDDDGGGGGSGIGGNSNNTHMYNMNFMCEIRVGLIIVYNVEKHAREHSVSNVIMCRVNRGLHASVHL